MHYLNYSMWEWRQSNNVDCLLCMKVIQWQLNNLTFLWSCNKWEKAEHWFFTWEQTAFYPWSPKQNCSPLNWCGFIMIFKLVSPLCFAIVVSEQFPKDCLIFSSPLKDLQGAYFCYSENVRSTCWWGTEVFVCWMWGCSPALSSGSPNFLGALSWMGTELLGQCQKVFLISYVKKQQNTSLNKHWWV